MSEFTPKNLRNVFLPTCKLRMAFPKMRDADPKKSKMDFYYKINMYIFATFRK